MSGGKYDAVIRMIQDGATDVEIVEKYPEWRSVLYVCRKIVNGEISTGVPGALPNKAPSRGRPRGVESFYVRVIKMYHNGFSYKEIAKETHRSESYIRLVIGGYI